MCCVDRLNPHLKADVQILPGNVDELQQKAMSGRCYSARRRANRACGWRIRRKSIINLMFLPLERESFGCGSFRTGGSGAVERKMDLSYYGSSEGILGLGSWVGQNNLTRKTERLDCWDLLT